MNQHHPAIFRKINSAFQAKVLVFPPQDEQRSGVEARMSSSTSSSSKKKEIYTHQAPWPVYAMGFCERAADPYRFRFAMGSFVEEYTNEVHVVQYDEASDAFVRTSKFSHPYPATKIAWAPDPQATARDLVATSGDYLRVWEIQADGSDAELQMTLNNSKHQEYCAPLTSLDWNQVDLSVVGTSSIDTTCTIWNLDSQKITAQLIAHDEEVYDIAFATKDRNVFASASADGSVRMFDLRQLTRSSIIYEAESAATKQRLIRLAWNRQDPNFLAFLTLDSQKTFVIDKRVPAKPYAELNGHVGSVNAVAWAPHSSCHICTVAEDSQALIWELSTSPREINEPILAYKADSCIDQLQWSSATPDWVGIGFEDKIQVLRV